MNLQFETFLINTATRTLWMQGQEVLIGSRAFDVLLSLAQRYGQVVSKRTLLNAAWPGLVVEENNLMVQIASLRKVLGKEAITTVSGRGYSLTQRLVNTTESTATSANTGTPQPWPSRPAPSSARLLRTGVHGLLSSYLPKLYGRDAEAAAVDGLLLSHRLVTLTGAGGLGKTHLACSLGLGQPKEKWPHGVWLIQAETCHDLPSLLQKVILSLDLNLDHDGGTVANSQNRNRGSAEVVQDLCKALQNQHLLLIVDNCEHILEATQVLLSALLDQVSGLHVLATSQVPLRIAHEYVYQLAPLSLPASDHTPEQARQSGAMQLLLGRLAQLHQRYAQISAEDLLHARNICQQLDGMALALVLAAARVPLLGLSAVSAHLSSCMDLLESNMAQGQMSRRHNTLRTVMDWTYRLLEPAQAQTFRRLGVLQGSFDLSTAKQLLRDAQTPDWQVLKTLDSLLHYGFLMVAEDGAQRYRLLQPHRLFALEKLRETQELDDWQRHFAHTMLLHCDKLIEERASQTLWAELPQFDAALEWACAQDDQASHALAVGLVVNTAMVWMVGNQAGQALNHLQRVKPWVDQQSSPLRAAKYWQWLGRCGVHGRLPTSQCIAAFEKALQIFTELKNTRHMHACQRMLAESYLESGQFDAAHQALEQAQAMETAQTPIADSMRRIRAQGLVLQKQGHLQASLHKLQSALSMAEMAEIERYVLTIKLDIARLWIEMDKLAESLQLFEWLKHSGQPHFFQQLTIGSACADWLFALLKSQDWVQAAQVCIFALPYWQRSGVFARYADVFAWWMVHSQHVVPAVHMLIMADSFYAQKEIKRGHLPQKIHAETMQQLAQQHSEEQLQTLFNDARASQIDQHQLIHALATHARGYLAPDTPAAH